MEEPKEKSLPFCLAPWVHAHIQQNGDRKLCCVAEPFPESLEPTTAHHSFKEFWNSDLMKSVRKEMMEGRSPEQCRVCQGNQRYTKLPRDMYNTFYKDLRDEILTKTDSDGFYEGVPRYLDYRMNSICNFSCRMCNSTSSSTIKSLELKAGWNVDEETGNFASKEYEEIRFLVESGKVDRFYFADGEPLISPYHWKIIDLLREYNLQGQVTLIYNTNLSIFERKGVELSEELSDFSQIGIVASVDAPGEIGEFIRDGLDWNVAERNLQKWIDFLGDENVSINITMTTPVLLNLNSLIDFLGDYRLPYIISLCSNDGKELIWSPLSLDRKTLDNIVQSNLEKVPKGSYFDEFRSFLNLLKEKKNFEESEENWREDLASGFDYLRLVDKFRLKKQSSIDWFMKQEELKEWFEKVMQVYLEQRIKYPAVLGEVSYPYDVVRKNEYLLDSSVNSSIRTFIFDNSFFQQREIWQRLQALQKERGEPLKVIVIDSSPCLFNKILLKRLSIEKKFFNDELDSNSKRELSGSSRFHLLFSRPLELNVSDLVKRKIFLGGALMSVLSLANKLFPHSVATQYLWVGEIRGH